MKNRHFVYIILTVIVLGLLLVWYAGRPKPETVNRVKPSLRLQSGQGEVAQRNASLYFSSDNGRYLVSESRQIGCTDETDCVQAVVEALISGPLEDGIAVLPEKATVNAVSIEEGTAIIDFSPEFVSGHWGGSQTELLTLYALANSVAVNFPHLRQVSVLVDGKTVESIRGHVDLRNPVIADFTYARATTTDR